MYVFANFSYTLKLLYSFLMEQKEARADTPRVNEGPEKTRTNRMEITVHAIYA